MRPLRLFFAPLGPSSAVRLLASVHELGDADLGLLARGEAVLLDAEPGTEHALLQTVKAARFGAISVGPASHYALGVAVHGTEDERHGKGLAYLKPFVGDRAVVHRRRDDERREAGGEEE